MKNIVAVFLLFMTLHLSAAAETPAAKLPPIKRQPNAEAVVAEHLAALNKCDYGRLMALYPPNVHLFLPGGKVIDGREQTAAVYRVSVKPFKDGGACGLKFEAEKTFKVGDTVNVQWKATADFLAEPYRGADAYVTKDGLMWAQVTTYDHAQIKAK